MIATFAELKLGLPGLSFRAQSRNLIVRMPIAISGSLPASRFIR
jgi:hypothetical protein